MPKKKTAAPTPEYFIVSSFTHKGKTIGPGEPIPAMKPDELESYIQLGVVVKIEADGTLPRKTGPIPKTVDQFLNGSDIVVMQRIRQHKPDMDTMRRIQAEAKRTERSHVFREALAMILGDEPGSAI